MLGCEGKWAIHPSQIPIANAVFAPTEQEIALAQRNMAAYREAGADVLYAPGPRRRDDIEAIDIRPATGGLFALGSGSRLYSIKIGRAHV